jgi:hypothetical protein
MGYKDKLVKDSKAPYINCSASVCCLSLPAIKPVFCTGKHHLLPDVKLLIVVVVTCSVQLALPSMVVSTAHRGSLISDHYQQLIYIPLTAVVHL